MQAWLEGPVREAAVVYVNDRRAGSVWCPPYSLDVTGFLQPGQNRLRIVVANLAVNHMAGRRLPDYRLLNLRYGVRFEAQDLDKVQAVPAGLLGPIRLKPKAEPVRSAYRRIAFSNQRFGINGPGWKIPRGRLYIIYGPPDEIESHPSPPEPLEKWRYRSGVLAGMVIEFSLKP